MQSSGITGHGSQKECTKGWRPSSELGVRRRRCKAPAADEEIGGAANKAREGRSGDVGTRRVGEQPKAIETESFQVRAHVKDSACWL